MAQQRLDKIIASTGRYSRREVKTLVPVSYTHLTLPTT